MMVVRAHRACDLRRGAAGRVDLQVKFLPSRDFNTAITPDFVVLFFFWRRQGFPAAKDTGPETEEEKRRDVTKHR